MRSEVTASSPRAADDTDVAAARAAVRFSKAADVALASLPLSLPQYRLLVFLSAHPERATALAARLDVSPPSLTALVDGCVARGLVERRPSQEDRRRVVHAITPAGDDLLARADRLLADRLSELCAGMDRHQRGTVFEGLELLGRALDEARARRHDDDRGT